MKRRGASRRSPTALRRRAEARLEKEKPAAAAELLKADPQRLVHELEVHQVELEMQNEELRAARISVEAALARYTELFDFAPIGYASLGPDGEIREINHAGARILKMERSQLIGRKFGDLLAAGHRVVLAALIGRARESQARETCEVELPRIFEGPLHLRLGVAVLPHAAPSALLAFEDVTERIAREKRLAETERALREADRRKDEFLGVLSHELRNPLSPIRNSLYVLSRTDPAGEGALKAQAVIERQVTHLTRLVDDLLDVTRISRGKIKLQRERLELGELVRSTMEDHRGSFELSGVQLEGRLEQGPFWMNADPTRLIQMLSNLLANAEKFTPGGGRVQVSLGRDGDMAALQVSDTGAGIAPELLGHLFKPFTQAPQTVDRSRGGLGLGLAMVKGLVELHGGTVAVASGGQGRGTAILVRLPLDMAPVEVAPEEEPPPLRSRRVLVVEDNRDAANSLRDALELSGHECEAAYDGPAAIELARKSRPEVVICDIGLPGMNGYEVARAFRADPTLRSAYLVALTGYAMPEDLERAAEAGFDEHVTKPPTLQTLNRLVGNATDRPNCTAPLHAGR